VDSSGLLQGTVTRSGGHGSDSSGSVHIVTLNQTDCAVRGAAVRTVFCDCAAQF
jgi:hypothetical protein